jgi:phosphoribosylglycinamide formyltransferase-1
MQGAVGVRDDDTPETLAARVLEVEHRIYPDALRLLATDLVRLEGDICKTAKFAASDDALISPTIA